MQRVRAILINGDHLLTIKRIKPGQQPYWVLPGGHVEPDDATLEQALHRELREELAAEADIHALVHIRTTEEDRQYFFLAFVRHYSFADRTGPEFTEAGRGQYLLDRVPLTADGIRSISLQPPCIAEVLATALATDGLLALPDLRPVESPDVTPSEWVGSRPGP